MSDVLAGSIVREVTRWSKAVLVDWLLDHGQVVNSAVDWRDWSHAELVAVTLNIMREGVR